MVELVNVFFKLDQTTRAVRALSRIQGLFHLRLGGNDAQKAANLLLLRRIGALQCRDFDANEDATHQQQSADREIAKIAKIAEIAEIIVERITRPSGQS